MLYIAIHKRNIWFSGKIMTGLAIALTPAMECDATYLGSYHRWPENSICKSIPEGCVLKPNMISLATHC